MFSKKLLTAAFAAAVSLPLGAAHANTITLTTAQSEFSAGTLNQGWWASNSPNTNQNDNHITGPYNSNEYRSFYTFDLSNMTGTVKSASLLVKNGSQPGPVTLGLWDVTTAASIVNNNDGMDEAVFADLGSGKSYGSYLIQAGSPFDTYLSLSLNTQAFSDLGKANGFFTIGATASSAQSNFIFGATGGDVTSLRIEFADAPSAKVPEPASLALLLAGVGGLVAARRRK